MRITGGFLKNRTLVSPKQIRPTSEKLRQSVFNICQHEVEGAHFLDVFAGSGAMGIEALSRGAASATFIEKDFASMKAIKQNLSAFNLTDQSTLLSGDALNSLKQLAKQEIAFDLIFIDPPYGLKIKGSEKTYGEKVLEIIDESHLLKKPGTLFFEERNFSDLTFEFLKLVKKRQMGSTILLQFEL